MKKKNEKLLIVSSNPLNEWKSLRFFTPFTQALEYHEKKWKKNSQHFSGILSRVIFSSFFNHIYVHTTNDDEKLWNEEKADEVLFLYHGTIRMAAPWDRNETGDVIPEG